jgi:hypothetical protein
VLALRPNLELDDPQAAKWFAFSLVSPEETYIFCTETELDRENVLFFAAYVFNEKGFFY